MTCKNTHFSIDLDTDLKAFKKVLLSDKVEAVHIYSEEDKIVFFISSKETYKGKRVSFSYYKKFTGFVPSKPFKLFLYKYDCGNLKAFFRLVRKGKKPATFTIWFNNSSDLLKKANIWNQTLIMKYGSVKIEYSSYCQAHSPVANFKQQDINIDYTGAEAITV